MAPVRAVIFDLDECVIDPRPAWAYTVEQTLLAITGRQLRVSNELVEEYRRRPWRHAFAILTSDTGEADRCCALAETMYHRSGLKRLLVHDGIGMALDALRASRVQVGAISRLPHGQAVRQMESTGVDRFVLVLSPTAPGNSWTPSDRVAEVLTYLGRTNQEAAFVAADEEENEDRSELLTIRAGWATKASSGLHHPSEIADVLRRRD